MRTNAGRTGGAGGELLQHNCRMVHGSKGSGGAYGLHVLGSDCHRFEDGPNLVALNPPRLDERHAGQYRRYTDLLHETATRAASGPENFSEIGNRLATLRPERFPRALAAGGISAAHTKCTSSANSGRAWVLSRDAERQPRALLRALTEPCDVLIAVPEIPVLHGTAMLAVIRLANHPVRALKAILITANRGVANQRCQPDPYHVLQRDATPINSLQRVCEEIRASPATVAR